MECRNRQISDHRYLESFQGPTEKVEFRTRGTNCCYWSFEDQRSDLGIIFVDNDESRPFILDQITLKF